MKYFTTITLALLSLNAMALPVLTEPQEGNLPVFKDHLDSQKIHFIPDMGGIAFDRDEVPKFSLDEGFLSATFVMKKSDELQGLIRENLKDGKQVSVLPVMSSYLNVDNSLGYFMKGDLVRRAGQFGDEIPFMAILTDEGAKYLPDQLRTRPASFRNFSACYEVSGISPVFDASIKYDAGAINRFFNIYRMDPIKLTKTSIKDLVKALITADWISLEIHSGETTKEDYAAAITDHLIKTMFVHDYGNQYRVKPTGTLSGFETLDLKGKENIQREYCIQISLRDLKLFPELITK